ncbi:L-idonate 5-dehydrogenase [Puniceibacterium confluentis]|uniref:L-idonate 5-dehydrogenase n=1 Tax=Puniceibacterium confluentis TaxID=1958944 RepID=UPI0011B4983C|nr:L-idonate 5-dehydrogenase [Puniceibacterium confluentis]
MRAVILHAPRDLRIEDIPDAGQPGTDEVRVTVANGGICGSDLHYYHHGGFGVVRLRQPMALGHEVSGVVSAIGRDVVGLSPGDRVAVNPSRPCGHCPFCRRDQSSQCSDMRFNGSAMRFPHEQGLFRAEVIVPAPQAVRLHPDTDLALAAMSEPFAVCLNAVAKAGSLLGQRVLVAGCGPIGCLTIVAAAHAGASEIIATDIAGEPLRIASRVGAGETIDLTRDAAALDRYRDGKGRIDVVFECSGPAPALRTACELVRPGGQVITVGLGPDIPLPLGLVVTKEIRISGSFRFDREFATAADLISRGRVDLRPLLTGIFPAQDAVRAFEMASDKTRAMKVQLQF